MRKTLYLTLTGFLIFSFLAGQTIGQSADEILEKMIKAQGGREKLAAIKDTTATYSFEMPAMGMSGEMMQYRKEPNLLRIDIEVMGMTQAYDGETAWFVDHQTGTSEKMSEWAAEMFKRYAYGNDALLNPKKFGISYALKDKETIEGKEYFVLVQTFNDGYTVTIYVDPETYLTYKTKSTTLDQFMVETESEIICSNYKEVDGTMVAFDVTILEGGEVDTVYTASEIKYNTGLEDSLFKME